MYKIMVVDDDPDILEVLYFNLKARGFDVSTVSSGQEALQAVPLEQPDLLLLDVIMPDLDGWEVLKIIKDHYDVSEMKVIMLTAKNTERDKLIGTSILKADGYVTKPFDINELLEIIREVLRE
jgi:DNA-binding response OmpR family regulator